LGVLSKVDGVENAAFLADDVDFTALRQLVVIL
jgi:hypothetical protein